MDLNEAEIGGPLGDLLNSVDDAESLSDVGEAIDEFRAKTGFRLHHFVICKIENVSVRDVVYARPLDPEGMLVAETPDVVRSFIVEKALEKSVPFELLSQPVSPGSEFDLPQLRERFLRQGVTGIWIVPFTYRSTLSVVVLTYSVEEFSEKQHVILPIVYQLLTHFFARFPTLARWPEEYRLTPREAEVLHHASLGLAEKEVAKVLSISINTVRNHIENSKRKLEARNKAHAIAIATAAGEIDVTKERRRRSP